MSILNRIADIQAQLDGVKAEAEAQATAQAAAPTTTLDSPEIREAAQALAQAIAKAQGIDMPLRIAEGSAGLPVFEIPAEFAQSGGIGIGVIASAPPR